MNPRAQQVAIAAILGWAYDSVVHGWRHKSTRHMFSDCPDYPNDLDAMHDAEKTLTAEQRTNYIFAMAQITGHQSTFATAAQRAEAFLRVHGKWVES